MHTRDILEWLREPLANFVDEPFIAKASAVAQPYDPLICSYYIELRVGADPARGVDLLASIAGDDRQRLLDVLERQPGACPDLQRVCASWCDPSSRLHDALDYIGLEFDDVQDLASAPSFATCMVSGYRGNPDALPEATPRECLELAQATHAIMFAGRARDHESDSLRRVYERLPPGAAYIHLSGMTGRASAAAKLYGRVPRCSVVDYLAAIGWAPHAAELRALVDRLCVEDDVYLDVALAELGGRLGIVFAQQQVCAHDPARAELLERLVHAGLCTAEQADALAQWSGVLPVATDTWPVLIRRWLDLKLVWSPNEPVRTKAYLGFAASPWLPFDILGVGARVSTPAIHSAAG